MPKKRKKRTVNDKLDLIIRNERKILKNQKKIVLEEQEQSEDQENLEDLEKKQLQELDDLEKQIYDQVGKHPLTKITIRDFFKGMVGAFVGIISHFAFSKGVEIAMKISNFQAGMLYLVSFIIGAVLLYATGFRRIKQVKFFSFMPVRILVLYSVAILTVTAVLTIFKQYHSLNELYKQVAVVSLPAIIGAGAADLIGRE
jgi:uncharacterized membrane protein